MKKRIKVNVKLVNKKTPTVLIKDFVYTCRKLEDFDNCNNKIHIIGLDQEIVKKSYVCIKFHTYATYANDRSVLSNSFNIVNDSNDLYSWIERIVKDYHVIGNKIEIVRVIKDDGCIESIVEIIEDIADSIHYHPYVKVRPKDMRNCIYDCLNNISLMKDDDIIEHCSLKFGNKVANLAMRAIHEYQNIGGVIKNKNNFYAGCIGIDDVLNNICINYGYSNHKEALFDIDIFYKKENISECVNITFEDVSKELLRDKWNTFVENNNLNANSIKRFVIRPTKQSMAAMSTVVNNIFSMIKELFDNHLINENDINDFDFDEKITKIAKDFKITTVNMPDKFGKWTIYDNSTR